MPISTSLVIALGASFVCSVLKTRCPVRDAWIAVSALVVVAVEDSHHDRLAVRRREDADTQVDVLTGHEDLDAAVLGPPLLGDVDESHDLDPADDRAEEPSRGAVAFHQHAVDPV